MNDQKIQKENIFKRMREDGLTAKDRIDLLMKLDKLNPTTEEGVLFYSLWSKNYEKDSDDYPVDFSSSLVAKELNELISDKGLSIIDVGAGTGEGGEEVVNFGFINIDGIDASDGMLEIAKKKNIYKNIYCEMILDDGSKPKSIKNEYDVVISSSSFWPYHLEGAHLTSVLTMAKKGAYLIFASFVDEETGIREAINKLKDSKTIEVIKDVFIPKLKDEELYADGTLWILKKLQ